MKKAKFFTNHLGNAGVDRVKVDAPVEEEECSRLRAALNESEAGAAVLRKACEATKRLLNEALLWVEPEDEVAICKGVDALDAALSTTAGKALLDEVAGLKAERDILRDGYNTGHELLNEARALRAAEVERLTRERDEARASLWDQQGHVDGMHDAFQSTGCALCSAGVPSRARADKAEAELREIRESACARSDHKHFDTARAHAEALAGALTDLRDAYVSAACDCCEVTCGVHAEPVVVDADAALAAYHATTETKGGG